MAVKTYTPLLSEVLDKVHKAKTKSQKIKLLQENDSEALRMIIKSSFDPKIIWSLPSGAVPYKPNEAPEGTEHTLLSQESKRLYHFIQGADNVSPRAQKENMYIQLLEGLHMKQNYLSMQKIRNFIKSIKVYHMKLSRQHLVGILTM